MYCAAIWRTILLIFVCVLSANTEAKELWPTLSPYDSQEGGENDAVFIIGIEDYLAAYVPDVLGAQQNARYWYQFFARTRGVPENHIHFLKNQDAIVEAIRDSAETATSHVKGGGTLWVVFIGHGAPSKDGSDEVLIGADTQ